LKIKYSIKGLQTQHYDKRGDFPSTVKHWNNLSNDVKNASSVSSFKSLLKSHFCRKGNELFHFGERRRNIWHCQIRNSANKLNLDLYNQSLSATPMCLNCTDVIEDAYIITFLSVLNEMTKITVSNQSRKSKRKYKSENGRTRTSEYIRGGIIIISFIYTGWHN
jgi:hypothetical protein